MLPSSQMRGEFRVGRVSSIDADRHTVRVEFSEIDGFISYDLQVLVTRPGDYSLPATDTPVLCALMDGTSGVGYVLGAIYTEQDPAPLDNADQRAIVGDDIRLGTSDASKAVALDEDEVDVGTLKVTAVGSGVITGTYTDGIGTPELPWSLNTPIPLKGKISASAQNVKGS